MLHTEPVGRHLVEVCTNVSCALQGAQGVVDAFERARTACRPDDGRRQRHAAHGRVPRRLRLGDVVAVDNRHRLHVQAADVHGIVKELAE